VWRCQKIMKAFTVAATALAVLPRMAWAHHFMGGGLPETFAQGLLSGLGHPVIGLDHAAFILAAGFFLALVEGGMWGVPALIGGSLIGATLHLTGFVLPGSEVGVALSVILIGGLVMVRARGQTLLAGRRPRARRHSARIRLRGIHIRRGGDALVAYLVGFSVIQLGIAAAAFLIHRRLIATREAWARPVSSGFGAVVGAMGVVFLLINIAS